MTDTASNHHSHLAVIDIGKTNAKVVLVNIKTRNEVTAKTTPNQVLNTPPYPHYDIEGLWQFFLNSLSALQHHYRIDHLIVITHGAAAVLLDHAGDLALPVMDYENQQLNAIAESYRSVRPAFEQTGSPELAGGLNIGRQLYWQQQYFPTAFENVANILMYPQYWAYRFSGVLANEVTSLGCHTDLWSPATASYSTLINSLDLKGKLPDTRQAADCLGCIRQNVVAQTGLDPATQVYTGMHDSNASLCSYLTATPAPSSAAFSVVSTGTWVVVMAVGNGHSQLDANRDTLMNVNVHGQSVPSARFMGGREFSIITQDCNHDLSNDDITQVLSGKIMLLPSVEPTSGPFQHRKSQWTVPSEQLTQARIVAAASCYLALMTASCLSLIQAEGPIYIEGPFARNTLYCQMLAAATNREVCISPEQSTGTSLGALQLLFPKKQKVFEGSVFSPIDMPQLYKDYASHWKSLLD